MIKRGHLVTLVVAMTLLVAGCGSGQAERNADGTLAFRLQNAPAASTSARDWVAMDAGIFERHGLKPEQMAVTGGTAIVQAVAGGQVDVAAAGGSAVVRALAQDVPIQVIATNVEMQPWVIAARPGITRAADLRGKTFSSGDLGGAADLAVRRYLREDAGLTDAELTVVPAATIGERINALRAGSVDAAIVTKEAMQAAPDTQSLVVLKDYTADPTPYAFNLYFANRDFVEAHPEFPAALRAALAETSSYIMDPANEQHVRAAIATEMDSAPDSTLTSATYQLITSSDLFFPKDSVVDGASLQHLIDDLEFAEGTSYSDAIDPERSFAEGSYSA